MSNFTNYRDYERCCLSKLKVTSIVVAGGVMTITIVPLQAYDNYKYYLLEEGAALPAHTGIETVAITDGVSTYDTLDTNGQPVVSGKLRGHRCYTVRFGAGGTTASGTIASHFTFYKGLCCMEYSSNAALQDPAEVEG